MNELADATGGAEESAQVENIAEATAAQDTGTEESGQADDTGEATGDEEQPQKKVPWFQKRIDEVTRQKYDAQREADYWRGVAEGRVQPNQQAKEVGPPQIEQFADYDQYDAARIQYLAQQIVDSRLQEAEQRRQQTQALQTYDQKASEVRQAHPDYDTVVGDPSLSITPLMAQTIYEMDQGPEVAYFLGTNREEASRISRLAPHLQAAALGKIEAALGKATPVTPKTPPAPPPKTVAGLSAGISKDPGDMSMAEYVEWRKAQGM